MEQGPYVIRYLIDLLKHMKEHRSYDGRDESFKCCIGELTDLLKHMKEHRSYDGRDESCKCCIGELTELHQRIKMITIRPDNIELGTFTEPKKDAVDLKTIAVCMLKVNGKKNIEIEGKIEMIESRIRC